MKMISLWNRVFGARPDDPEARCYAVLAAQARRSEFYRWWGVPDTLEGRFELLVLHVFLVLHRLKRQGERARRFSRRLFEVMVADVDRATSGWGRGAWTGRSGTAVPVRALARGCNCRIHAYDNGLVADGDGEALVAALAVNLYRIRSASAVEVAGMVGYVRAASASLARQPLEHILAGSVRFPEPPVPEAVPERMSAGMESLP